MAFVRGGMLSVAEQKRNGRYSLLETAILLRCIIQWSNIQTIGQWSCRPVATEVINLYLTLSCHWTPSQMFKREILASILLIHKQRIKFWMSSSIDLRGFTATPCSFQVRARSDDAATAAAVTASSYFPSPPLASLREGRGWSPGHI